MQIPDQLIDQFLDQWTDASPSTIETYRRGLQRAQALGIEIDNDCLQKFDYLLAREGTYNGARNPLHPKTRHIYLASLQRFIQWMDAKDLLPEGFSWGKARARLKMAHTRARAIDCTPRIADPDLPQMVLYFQEAAEDTSLVGMWRMEALRNYAIIETLYSTGCRLAELCSLTRAQCGSGRIGEFMVTGKGGRKRLLYLSEPAKVAIQIYCRERTDQSPALFVEEKGHFNAWIREHEWPQGIHPAPDRVYAWLSQWDEQITLYEQTGIAVDRTMPCGRPRMVPFVELVPHLVEARYARMNPNRGNLKPEPIDRKTVYDIVKDAAKALGLQDNTSPHSFRHHLATSLLNNGCPLDSIQILLGHRSIVTTQSFYAHLNASKLKEQLAMYRRDTPEVTQ